MAKKRTYHKKFRNNRSRGQRDKGYKRSAPQSEGWQYVSKWYDGMVGQQGSRFHKSAIPTVLDLLDLSQGEHVLDIGCGQGVLAPHVLGKKARYTGVDISRSMIDLAQKNHPGEGTFITVDAAHLKKSQHFKKETFDATVFLLSIQDIRWYKQAIESASWVLKEKGRCVIYMTHPAFRVPRQSGWGYDVKRKLIFRRLDSYLSPLDVPLREHHRTRKTLTRSYHRPIGDYIDSLSRNSFHIDRFIELPSPVDISPKTPKSGGGPSRAEKRALKEFPLFLALRAVKQ